MRIFAYIIHHVDHTIMYIYQNSMIITGQASNIICIPTDTCLNNWYIIDLRSKSTLVGTISDQN